MTNISNEQTKMFDNYMNIPSTYIPNNNTIDVITTKVKKPLEVYNAKDELIGYAWHYGDSIVLEFITTGTVSYDEEGLYEDAKTYLIGKKFNIKIYNFRYEVVYEETIEASDVAQFYITEDISLQLVPSVYYGSVTLIDEENNIKQTLLGFDVCKFYIKN